MKPLTVDEQWVLNNIKTLTAREVQAFSLYVKGHTLIQIAAQLKTSYTNVCTTLANVRHKLGADSPHEMLTLALPALTKTGEL